MNGRMVAQDPAILLAKEGKIIRIKQTNASVLIVVCTVARNIGLPIVFSEFDMYD